MADFDENEDEQEEETPEKDSSVIAGFRKRERQYEKQLKELQAQVQGFETERKTAEVTAKFQAAGLPDSLTKFYLKDEDPGDPLEWAQANGFAPQEQEPESQPRQVHAPTPVGAPPGPTKMDRKEFDALMKSDPQRALQILKAGGVQFNHQSSYEVAAGKR